MEEQIDGDRHTLQFYLLRFEAIRTITQPPIDDKTASMHKARAMQEIRSICAAIDITQAINDAHI